MRPVAQVAQSVEQGIENPRVGGSIPSLGTKIPKTLISKEIRVFYCLRVLPPPHPRAKQSTDRSDSHSQRPDSKHWINARTHNL
jgi:hypothetical protein